MEDIYYKKYLKYKAKYLELLNSQEGGEGEIRYTAIFNNGQIYGKSGLLYTNQYMWISILDYLNNFYKPNKLNVNIDEIRSIASSNNINNANNANNANVINGINQKFNFNYNKNSLLAVIENYNIVIEIYRQIKIGNKNYINSKPNLTLPNNYNPDNPNILSILDVGNGIYNLITKIAGTDLYQSQSKIEAKEIEPYVPDTKSITELVEKTESTMTYKTTTTIEDYKKIIWYKNSCYFSVGMWFLWTLIPFRQFISNYSGDNDGFLAIKELFDKFNDSTTSEPVNIESIGNPKNSNYAKGIYERVFDVFIKNSKISFGNQESSSKLILEILDKTNNDELLNQIRLLEKYATECYDKNNKQKEILREVQTITKLTTTINNIFDEQKENFDEPNAIRRCKDLNPMDYGSTITKLDLLNETNEYFILEFTQEVNYSNVEQIEYNGKIFKIKSIVSYLGELTVSNSYSGHYICYVFDDNGLNPFVLDDIGYKKYKYREDLDSIKINSIVLYKLVNIETDSKVKTDRKTRPFKNADKNGKPNRITETDSKVETDLKTIPVRNVDKSVAKNVKPNRITETNRKLDIIEISEQAKLESIANIDILIGKLNERKNILENEIGKSESLPEKIKQFQERLVTILEQKNKLEDFKKKLTD